MHNAIEARIRPRRWRAAPRADRMHPRRRPPRARALCRSVSRYLTRSLADSARLIRPGNSNSLSPSVAMMRSFGMVTPVYRAVRSLRLARAFAPRIGTSSASAFGQGAAKRRILAPRSEQRADDPHRKNDRWEGSRGGRSDLIPNVRRSRACSWRFAGSRWAGVRPCFQLLAVLATPANRASPSEVPTAPPAVTSTRSQSQRSSAQRATAVTPALPANRQPGAVSPGALESRIRALGNLPGSR